MIFLAQNRPTCPHCSRTGLPSAALLPPLQPLSAPPHQWEPGLPHSGAQHTSALLSPNPCRRKGKGGTGLGRTLQGPGAQLWRLSGTLGPGHSLRSTQGSARRPLLSSLSSFISLWGAPRRSRGIGWGSGATRGAMRTTPGRASQHTSAHGAAPGG